MYNMCTLLGGHPYSIIIHHVWYMFETLTCHAEVVYGISGIIYVVFCITIMFIRDYYKVYSMLHSIVASSHRLNAPIVEVCVLPVKSSFLQAVAVFSLCQGSWVGTFGRGMSFKERYEDHVSGRLYWDQGGKKRPLSEVRPAAFITLVILCLDPQRALSCCCCWVCVCLCVCVSLWISYKSSWYFTMKFMRGSVH